jgi:trans-2,3-dihydro-3-hydroxyanthranilate isomerase
VQVWLMDAFSDTPFGGNPAGVVPNADGLSVDQMQSIANEIHASETAFVLPPTEVGVADFRIRYFTPTCEVDLCGHATVGALCGLFQHGVLEDAKEGTCRIETAVGVLNVSYGTRDGKVWAEMGQASPQFRETPIDRLTAAHLLGLEVVDLAEDLPCGLSFTGLWDLFVPVRSLEVMRRIEPNLVGLGEWNRTMGVCSTHVYTVETQHADNHFHARDFSPAVGIPEDPATGTATGALLALLVHHNLVQTNEVYRFEQGYEISRPSLIEARMVNESGRLSVRVGGNAYCVLEGMLNL